MFRSKEVFRILKCNPINDSASDKYSSGQETVEKLSSGSQTISGKRKNCEDLLSFKPIQQEKTSERSKPIISSKSFKFSRKKPKASEITSEELFYNQVCNSIKGHIQSALNNEMKRLGEEAGEEYPHITRLKTAASLISKVNTEKDVIERYLTIQSELIRNVSYTEFAKLIKNTNNALNT